MWWHILRYDIFKFIKRDAIAFLIGVTILHEYVHLSDIMFGETVWRINAGIILNTQN